MEPYGAVLIDLVKFPAPLQSCVKSKLTGLSIRLVILMFWPAYKAFLIGAIRGYKAVSHEFPGRNQARNHCLLPGQRPPHTQQGKFTPQDFRSRNLAGTSSPHAVAGRVMDSLFDQVFVF